MPFVKKDANNVNSVITPVFKKKEKKKTLGNPS